MTLHKYGFAGNWPRQIGALIVLILVGLGTTWGTIWLDGEDQTNATNVPITRTITASAPLSGGGSLAADRTLGLTNENGAAVVLISTNAAGTGAADTKLWTMLAAKTYADLCLPLSGARAMTGNLPMGGNDITGIDDTVSFNTSTYGKIHPETSDGSDFRYIAMFGGGSDSHTRGAVLVVSGNEADAGGWEPGSIGLYTGSESASRIHGTYGNNTDPFYIMDSSGFRCTTPIVIDTDAAITLLYADCQGILHINGDDDAIDYSLPTAAAGLVVTFANHLYAQQITVDAAAGDIIILNDGTALDAGDSIISSGAADDKATLVSLNATYWMVFSEQNTWTDNGP